MMASTWTLPVLGGEGSFRIKQVTRILSFAVVIFLLLPWSISEIIFLHRKQKFWLVRGVTTTKRTAEFNDTHDDNGDHQQATTTAASTLTDLRNDTTNHNNESSVVAPKMDLSSLSFVNRIMTTQDPVNPSCHRTCFDFRNKIYFLPPVGDPGAGLIDRLTIFGTMLNMAGYFCARLYVPRPKFLLNGARHNGGRSLHPKLSWSEFGTFEFWNDDQRQPALIDWDNEMNKEEMPLLESLINSTNNASLLLFQVSWKPFQLRHHFRVWEELVVTQQQQVQQQQQQSQQQSSGNNQNGFVWVIRAEFFDWCDRLARHLKSRPPLTIYKNDTGALKVKEPFIFAAKFFYEGCQYAKVRLPTHLLELQEKIVGEIIQQQHQHQHQQQFETSPQSNQPSVSINAVTTTEAAAISSSLPLNTLIGYIHIRRTDTRRECRTTPNRLNIYLNCSLGEAIAQLAASSSAPSSSLPRNIIILFSSDENNQQYRQIAMKLIEDQQLRSLGDSVGNRSSIHVTAMDLDHLAKEAIQSEINNGKFPAWRNNNFYLFQLVFSLGFNQTVVKFQMEQRRFNCGVCTNVTEQLIHSGVLS